MPGAARSATLRAAAATLALAALRGVATALAGSGATGARTATATRRRVGRPVLLATGGTLLRGLTLLLLRSLHGCRAHVRCPLGDKGGDGSGRDIFQRG